jgi:hypothetical protein
MTMSARIVITDAEDNVGTAPPLPPSAATEHAIVRAGSGR